MQPMSVASCTLGAALAGATAALGAGCVAAVAVPIDEVAAATRLLALRARVVAEGAGALALAAALRGAI